MRNLLKVVDAQATRDGDGVHIHRIGGRVLNQILNPFLMLDEINSDDTSDYIGGFPEHPHRGFETITYMKAGRMRHRDHMKNEGVVEPGGVQWMTAGRGVIHSEMPEQESGLLHGFQIWLNLPADEKMQPAAYRDFPEREITHVNQDNIAEVHVIAGLVDVAGQVVAGPLPARATSPVLMDVELKPNANLELLFSNDQPALVYVYKGLANKLHKRQLGVFSTGAMLKLEAGSQGASLLVLSGRVIAEPIVQHGPFVMNTTEEISQAFEDYRRGHLTSR